MTSSGRINGEAVRWSSTVIVFRLKQKSFRWSFHLYVPALDLTRMMPLVVIEVPDCRACFFCGFYTGISKDGGGMAMN